MNRHLSIYFLLIVYTIVASCSKDGVSEYVGEQISLCGVISSADGINVKSTAQIFKNAVPTSDSPLEADVWFSTTSGHYAGNTIANARGVSDDGLAIDTHRTIDYTSEGPTIPSDVNGSWLRYPSTGKTVYCIGLYPKGLWSTVNGTTIKAEIDGTSDLMFAPEIQGSNTNIFADNPQNYNHLLTLLKVRVRADREDAVGTWGKIKKITVSANDCVEINLATGNVEFSSSSSSPKVYSVYDGEYILTTVSNEIGSALLSSVVADGTSAGEYTFHIECQNYEKDLQVNLVDANNNHFSGDTAGRVFVITFYFKTLDYVIGEVSLEKWDEEYRDLILQ